MANSKLKSLSIFFPFYNDAGTVRRQIENAYKYGKKFADDLEVIALHGGASKDDTYEKILEMKKEFPSLCVVNKKDNKEGYAVIKHGFNAATKEWVFYTDGDAQYHLEEDLEKLVARQLKTGIDVINGYKASRSDNFSRVFLGDLYAKISCLFFELPIRDVDCDFRLIRKSFLDKIKLVSTDSSILAELVKKLEFSGASFVELPVSHYSRSYGKSNYSPWTLCFEKIKGDLTLYFKIRKLRPASDNFRIFRFSSVGVVCVLLQSVIFNLLVFSWGFPVFLSTILSDQLSIVLSFIANKKFTFSDRHTHGIGDLWAKFTRFYIVVISSTFIQASAIFLGSLIFGKGVIISNILFLFGLSLAFIWNYFLQKRLVWKKSTY